MKMPLSRLAFARSGDKGDTSNLGVVAFDDRCYALLTEKLTVDVVRQHFAAVCAGKVERFELPNLRALNFLLHRALEDGASTSLRTDAQGKIYGPAAGLIELELPDEFPVPASRI